MLKYYTASPFDDIPSVIMVSKSYDTTFGEPEDIHIDTIKNWYNDNGKADRKGDLPAYIFYINSKPSLEEWYINGI